VVSYLQAHASAFDLPIRLNSRVTSLARSNDQYTLTTPDGQFAARQVVVATGPFQSPFIPGISADFDETVYQIHSADYRNATQIPGTNVLVVGGGNSGFQIAEELQGTRKIDLSVAHRMPSLAQRFLGRDIFWWLTRTGLINVNVETRLGRRMSKRDVLIGSSPKRIRRTGVTLRDRLSGATGRRAVFADGDRLDVDAVVWATGYRSDYSWINIPGVIGTSGRVCHRRGVTDIPGLYFLGLTWQWTRGSALIGFVGNDAAFIADRIDSALAERKREPAMEPRA
jgi:putative flavoprotein involved in K+ transport